MTLTSTGSISTLLTIQAVDMQKVFDVFLRDKKSIPNCEYWISYSFIDTKRLYLNYPVKATPDFVSPHNLILSQNTS